jgi:hypothetical protein
MPSGFCRMSGRYTLICSCVGTPDASRGRGTNDIGRSELGFGARYCRALSGETPAGAAVGKACAGRDATRLGKTGGCLAGGCSAEETLVGGADGGGTEDGGALMGLTAAALSSDWALRCRWRGDGRRASITWAVPLACAGISLPSVCLGSTAAICLLASS